jgi:hypothetical protein
MRWIIVDSNFGLLWIQRNRQLWIRFFASAIVLDSFFENGRRFARHFEATVGALSNF